MSTTSAEILPPEYGATYLPMNKNTTATMYINGPSVSATQTTVTHQLPNGYATTTNGYSAAPEFTNLTPLMSGPPPTSQYTAQQILANTSSFLNDHSNPSSASSSRTKLQNIGLGEDSGISSHNGSLLMSGIGGGVGMPQMNGFGSPQMEIKLEDDLDPMPRDRCNTWPLRRPTLDINAQTSPLIHDRIPEEETIYDSSENLSQSGMLGPGDIPSNNSFSNDFVQIGSPDDLSQDGGNESPNSSAKKATTRRNAWGNMSYADLITQAILNSPEKRLTLSQVYEWMVQNVPYFRDKGDSNSSAGWKMKKIMESTDDNFFAQTRERCHTWPMPQYPGSIISSQSSTPYHSPLSSGYPSTSSINNINNNNVNQGPLPSISYFCGQPFQQQNIQSSISPLPYHLQRQQQQQYSSTHTGYNFTNFNIPLSNQTGNNNNNVIVPKKEIQTSPTKSNTSQEIPCDPAPSSVPPSSSSSIIFPQSSPLANASPEKPKRKRIRKKDPNHITQKKPNAWGEESYSDLILKALESAPDGRMKLNEIYQWFIDNVKYFGERAGQEEASGWKNSIRHNLSLHSRFMRIQNEGAGKSSWWVINPDAKPGRNPRRRAQTMESTTKAKLERSRRGARKRIEMAGVLRSGGSSAIGSTASIVSHEIFNDLDDPLNSNFDTFRGRTHSNLSAIGNTTRISPTVDRFDEFDFPPWGEQQRLSNPEVNEIMGRTGDMRLENNGTDFKTDFRGIPTTDSSTLLGDFPGPKLEFDDPPPYQELNPLRPSMPMQQPMMRAPFNPPRSQQPPLPQQMRMSNQPNGYYAPPPVYSNQPMMAPQQLNSQQQWTPMTGGGYPQMSGIHHTQNGQNPTMFEHHQQNQLPMDLEGLSLPDTMEFGSDVETILRHELSQTHDQQIHFDL